ncbi:hypothetical protein MFFC18_19000 [Mariniblastus fucicola]|uniref:Uncharacterized protein n=1 Tax=Mariniblastus fucicola TaxID=980251 RepID=A0A5B9P9D1_9BACT|nr:hypothetical protein MFFC18_19000 [Mariniblastus fucicola]
MSSLFQADGGSQIWNLLMGQSLVRSACGLKPWRQNVVGLRSTGCLKANLLPTPLPLGNFNHFTTYARTSTPLVRVF